MKEYTTHNASELENPITEKYTEEGIMTTETIDATPHHHKEHTCANRECCKNKKPLTTPVAIIIAAVIISVGIVGYGFITRDSGTGTKATMFTGRPIDATDYVGGKENSKVVVVEYGDPECPFCVQVSPTIKKLRAEYGNKVAFVYRYFPLTQIHSHAFDESRAIACSGAVGGASKLYAYIDAFFDYKISKQTTQLSATGKEDMARIAGIDMQAFANCMKTNQTEKIVSDSMNDGVAAGVQGTPSTFILLKTRKGYEVVSMVDGARPYEFFKASLDEALSR